MHFLLKPKKHNKKCQWVLTKKRKREFTATVINLLDLKSFDDELRDKLSRQIKYLKNLFLNVPQTGIKAHERSMRGQCEVIVKSIRVHQSALIH